MPSDVQSMSDRLFELLEDLDVTYDWVSGVADEFEFTGDPTHLAVIMARLRGDDDINLDVMRAFTAWRASLPLAERWRHCGAWQLHDEHRHTFTTNVGSLITECPGTPLLEDVP